MTKKEILIKEIDGIIGDYKTIKGLFVKSIDKIVELDNDENNSLCMDDEEVQNKLVELGNVAEDVNEVFDEMFS